MVLPSIILMVGLVYLEYELSETRKENQELIQQLLQFRQQSGGSEEGRKAYLKGAVKKHHRQARPIHSKLLSFID